MLAQLHMIGMIWRPKAREDYRYPASNRFLVIEKRLVGYEEPFQGLRLVLIATLPGDYGCSIEGNFTRRSLHSSTLVYCQPLDNDSAHVGTVEDVFVAV